MQLVSVIIPVYKVEEYLNKCLDSVLVQTYTNLEVILVDDGSPDNCGKICDEYAAKDKRIKVIHKENGGISDARNAGLDICKGEYIAFIDSDDWVDEDYIATFMDYAQSDTIVCCGYRRIYFDKVILHKMECLKEFTVTEAIGVQQEQELFFSSGVCNSNPIMNVPWNKFYPRKIFDDIRYPVGKVFEDVYICYELFFRSKKIIVVPKTTYNYRRREMSICVSRTAENIRDHFFARLKQENDVKNYPLLLKNAKRLSFNVGIALYTGYIKGFYVLNEDVCADIKDYFKNNSNLVSVSEWKLFIKYILILNCEFVLKYLFRICDVCKQKNEWYHKKY